MELHENRINVCRKDQHGSCAVDDVQGAASRNAPQDGDEGEHVVGEPAFDGSVPQALPWDLTPVYVEPACTEAHDDDVENSKRIDCGVVADVGSVASKENGVA